MVITWNILIVLPLLLSIKAWYEEHGHETQYGTMSSGTDCWLMTNQRKNKMNRIHNKTWIKNSMFFSEFWQLRRVTREERKKRLNIALYRPKKRDLITLQPVTTTSFVRITPSILWYHSFLATRQVIQKYIRKTT